MTVRLSLIARLIDCDIARISYTSFTRSSKHRASSSSQLHRVNGVLLSLYIGPTA